MNVIAIKNPFVRRLNLLWIVPYLILCPIPYILYIGCAEFIPDFLKTWREDLIAVWKGKR